MSDIKHNSSSFIDADENPKYEKLASDEEDIFVRENVSGVRVHHGELLSRVENKKEELRLLVGKRYRDILKSADAIQHMAELSSNSSKQWQQVVSNMQTMRESVSLFQEQKHATTTTKSYTDDHISMSDCRIAVANIGRKHESVCECISQGHCVSSVWEYTRAVQAFDQATHTLEQYVQQSGKTPEWHRALTAFVQVQWNAITTLPGRIETLCLERLRNTSTCVEHHIDALVAWKHMRNEAKQPDISTECLIDMYLDNRLISAVNILKVAEQTVSKYGERQVPYIVRHITTLLTSVLANTVGHVALMFCSHRDIHSIAETIMGNIKWLRELQQDQQQRGHHYHHHHHHHRNVSSMSFSYASLESDVLGDKSSEVCLLSYVLQHARRVFDTANNDKDLVDLEPIGADLVRIKLGAWLDKCLDTCQDSFSQVLGQIKRGQDLADVRDAAWQVCIDVPCISHILQCQHEQDQERLEHPADPDSKLPTPKGAPVESIRITSSNDSKRAPQHDHKDNGDGYDSQREFHFVAPTRAFVQSRQRLWHLLCRAALGRSLALWDHFFATPFNRKCQALVQKSFDTLRMDVIIRDTVDSLRLQLRYDESQAKIASLPAGDADVDADADVDVDVGVGVVPPTAGAGAGAELEADVAQLVEEVSAETKKRNKKKNAMADSMLQSAFDTFAEEGILSEAVSDVGDQFDEQLSLLLRDMRFITHIPDRIGIERRAAVGTSTTIPTSPNHSTTTQWVRIDEMKSLRQAVNNKLIPLIQRMCTASIGKMVSNLQERLTGIQSRIFDLNLKDDTDVSFDVDQAIFVGRVCVRVLQRSQPLRRVITMNAGTASVSTNDISTNATFEYVRESLTSTAHVGFRIWTRYIATKLADRFRRQFREEHRRLLTARRQGHIPHTSELLVPRHVSQYIAGLLFEMNSEVYRVCGSAIDKYILQSLSTDTADAICQVLESLVSSGSNLGDHMIDITSLSEQESMAMLFDVSFLLMVLLQAPATTIATCIANPAIAQADALLQRFSTQLTQLYQRIDPINWASMSSTFENALLVQSLRSSALLGASLHSVLPRSGATSSTTGTKSSEANVLRFAKNNYQSGNAQTYHALPVSLYPAAKQSWTTQQVS
jgi:Vps51/EXO84/COG1 N-terminal